MKTTRLYLCGRIMRLLPETRFFAFKSAMLRWCGAEVGKNVRICSSATIMGNGPLKIGDDVWIGEGCFIRTSPGAGISIGSCCDIGPRVSIVTGTHEIVAAGPHVAGTGRGLSVSIGVGCWLCLRSTILPGVRLAARTLVAAGSVVTRDVKEDGVMVAGVPAVEKGRLK